MTIKFDIVLPTIGRDSLPQAIQSVLNQTYKDFRLWVVCDKYHLPDEAEQLPYNIFFLYVEGPGNDSGACARNHGIEKINQSSDYNWIAYIDDDDEWHPNHLEVLARLHEENPHATMLKTAGQEFRMKHRHPRSSKKVRKLGPINTRDHLTVGMSHTRELFNRTSGWHPGTAHDKDLWQAMISSGGITASTDNVTYIFKR